MFETIGYFKEYYIDRKFIGTLKCELGEREIGYNGRLGEVVFEKLRLDNGKVIKANTVVTTIVFPLCGKATETK
jgi:hypothetical protein